MITAFARRGDQRWSLTYTLKGQNYSLRRAILEDGAMDVENESPDGTIDHQTWPKHEQRR